MYKTCNFFLRRLNISSCLGSVFRNVQFKYVSLYLDIRRFLTLSKTYQSYQALSEEAKRTVKQHYYAAS